MTQNPYRNLPSVDRILSHDLVKALSEGSGDLVTGLARRALDEARRAISEGREAAGEDELAEEVAGLARAALQPSLRPVINATGVILQTNLGRAPLSGAARQAMDMVSRGYSNLEFDLESGERGSRYSHLRELIRQVTGAESGIAVNNNAAALMLVLSTLTAGREVVVSRGQAVEIGGGFRIPDVMRQSGAFLVEVGTTNRTYLGDYEAAVGPETAAVMRVHASNFKVVGFTHQPSLADMVKVAQEHGLLMIDDLGSGCLLDVKQFGLAAEPTVQDSVEARVDLCLFSGDKLLGGPQAGIIAGRADLIERIERNPLARALRPDKGTIAGLHATLLHYVRGEALEQIPVWRMISMPIEAIEVRANTWAQAIGEPAQVIDGRSMIGGGSLPEESLPTKLLALPGEGGWLNDAAHRLRVGEPAVVARIDDGRLLLDPRT
ncbi:MAG: L-seryl-tRNA(Sec) selenium transferase, partial [Dehalococcoidia bacterium]